MMTRRAAPCLHCRRPGQYCRGLCLTCFQSDTIRDLFPKLRSNRRGVGVGNDDMPVDDAPTEAWPGSEEKIKVMEDRAARGRAIFHPGDR